MPMIVTKLRDARESLDIKQKDLTELYQVKKSTISGWENGHDTIPLIKLILFANKYNYSLDYLFGLIPHNIEYEKIEISLPKIGKNLKIIRKINYKTQEEIAHFLGISQSTYSHYEKGIRLIPTNYIYSLSQIYKNYSIDKILNRKRKIKK